MEEKQWNVISKKIRRNVPVLTNPAAERASVVNSPDVYSLPRWREPMTVQLKNLLKRIRNIEKNYIIMQNK